MEIKIKDTINLPKTSIERLLEAMRFFELAQDEIEDFLLFQNKTILTKIKKAHKEHKQGKTKDFQELIKRHV